MIVKDMSNAPMSVSTTLGGDINSPHMVSVCQGSDVVGGSAIYSALSNVVGSGDVARIS